MAASFYSSTTSTATATSGIYRIDGTTLTTSSYNNIPVEHDQFYFRAYPRRPRNLVSDFSGQMKIWLAYAAERARARWIFEQQTLYARRIEPEPARPLRLPRGRVSAGSNRYRVMFY